ncbi:MAG: hypothetical protein HC780_13890 [Leptolyngbyaceae cyanobacterium CSU_1_3]|nr:hypothetical protein [Leptolyngbyaceae cyanobacterium CSU_1_3]
MLVKLLILALLIFGAWLLYSKSFRRSSRSHLSRRSSPPKKLISLLNGDAATAQRLFERAQIRHPDQSDQWYWEKVIWDLERDRRW